jgi:DNA repair protein RecO
MSLFRGDSIVLRTQKLGEADRIITLLTRGHRRVRAVARGARRTKSKFGARLEPFSHVDVQFFAGGRRENDMVFRHSCQQRVSITRQRQRPGRRVCATDTQMTKFN